MEKFNLILNKIFENYTFESNYDFSIYNSIKNTLLKYLCIINTHPTTSNTNQTVTVAINNTIDIYITPLSLSNFNLNKGDILQFPDNNSLYVIEANINENLFTIRLIDTNGSSHTFNNNDICFIYNKNIFNLLNNYNNIKNILKEARNNFITLLNNNNLQTFINENIQIKSTNTDFTCIITMNHNNPIDRILNKFYININVFDYNSFKYIYNQDIKLNISEHNVNNPDTYNLSGILKFETLKLMPHFTDKLLTDNTITYTSNKINQLTIYEKNYDNDKLIFLFQLTLSNKQNILDRFNNIESDYIYIIY